METHKHHKKRDGNDRCVETLFRVTFNNQIHLIQIADNKANSIITINTLVITLLIGLSGYGSVTQKLESTYFIFPILLLVVTSLVSVIFALLATQPRIVKTNNKAPEITPANSLLFFGSISDKSLASYLAEMDELTHSPDSIHHAMEVEIYNQSKVLNRKYRLLGLAFQVFKYGFISSVLVFAVCLFIGF